MRPTISYITSHSGLFADLRRCILSVFRDCNSTKILFEHLVWIDGSHPNLSIEEQSHKNFVKQFEFDSNGSLKLFWAHHNKGKASCINRLLMLAKGDMISFLDSDDWILRGRSAHVVSFFSKNRINAMGTQYLTGPKNLKGITSSSYPLSDIEIRKNLLFFPYLLYSSLTISHNFIEAHNLKFNESLRAGLDIDFYYNVMRYTMVVNSSFQSVYYTKNPYGITSTRETRRIQLNSHRSVIKKILSEGDDGQLAKHVDYLSIKLMQTITSDNASEIIDKPILSPGLICKMIKSNWDCSDKSNSYIARLPSKHRSELLSHIFARLLNE